MPVLAIGKKKVDKHLIHKALKSSDWSEKISTDDLATIAERFPYFTTAQLLLTKAYQQTEDYRFTDQLHQAAIYTPDRKILYDLVQKAKQSQTSEHTLAQPEISTNAEIKTPEITVELIPDNNPVVTEQLIVPDAKASAVIAPEDDLIAEILASKNNEDPKLVDHLTDTETIQEDAVEIDPVSEVHSEVMATDNEVAEEIEETTNQKVLAKDLDPLNREILLEAISSSIELEVSEPEEDLNTAPETVALELPSSTSELTDSATSGEPKTLAEYLALRAKQLHFGEMETAPLSDKEALNMNSGADRSTPEPLDAAVTESKKQEEDHTEIQLATAVNSAQQKLQAANQKEHQQSLIDKFIKSEPRITPGKAADYNLIPSAKESLEEDLDFVTETMARLYAQQGKTDKARKAFKKLMELYPEKSVYFAAQLKNLDRLKKP